MKEIFVEKEKNNFKVLKVINIISVLYTFMRFVSVWIGNKDKKKKFEGIYIYTYKMLYFMFIRRLFL